MESSFFRQLRDIYAPSPATTTSSFTSSTSSPLPTSPSSQEMPPAIEEDSSQAVTTEGSASDITTPSLRSPTPEAENVEIPKPGRKGVKGDRLARRPGQPVLESGPLSFGKTTVSSRSLHCLVSRSVLLDFDFLMIVRSHLNSLPKSPNVRSLSCLPESLVVLLVLLLSAFPELELRLRAILMSAASLTLSLSPRSPLPQLLLLLLLSLQP